MKLETKIKTYRKLLKFGMICVMLLLSPIMGIAFVFRMFFEVVSDWRDRQAQKIEDWRVDLWYIKTHGVTRNEFESVEHYENTKVKKKI